MMGLVLIFLALLAYRSVFIDSAPLALDGDTHAICEGDNNITDQLSQ